MSEQFSETGKPAEREAQEVNDKSNQATPNSDATPSPEKIRPDDNDGAIEIESDIESLQKQLSESASLLNSYKDQLLRLAAEFENFKKRTETEKADFVKFSNEKIIRDILPVVDDFERALSNGKKTPDFDAFYKGVEMIYLKLQKFFDDKGVKPIESIGKEFDVMYHDVLMQIQRPGAAPHTVVEEVERGYTLNGKVIKHAKVIVAADNQGEENNKAAK